MTNLLTSNDIQSASPVVGVQLARANAIVIIKLAVLASTGAG
jgi:hypothetical protein